MKISGVVMSTVYVVHNIDTEGPLAEEHPGNYEPNLQFPHFSGNFNAGDMSGIIQKHRSRILGSWSEISAMLRVATSDENRCRLKDSLGNGWIFNWFCMDHIGFIDNPRFRSMGVHHIFDFYSKMIEKQRSKDSIHWHFHPMSTYKEAHICATSYINSPELYYILGRRLLDRKWFPKANRPGFQDERPDSNWFLEQWIPFDFANAGGGFVDPDLNPDLLDGRFSDWRWAPKDWITYHPHHDNIQREGNCRRKIARSLTLLNRLNPLNESEMEKAFKRAASGKPTMMCFESHDWRDLSVEMDYVRHLLRIVSQRYPKVKFQYSEAAEAFNAVHPPSTLDPLKLECSLVLNKRLPHRVNVKIVTGKLFGPQPFFVVKTRSKRIIHDNMNFWNSFNDFNYVFDENSILPTDVEAIGIASNDAAGNQSLHVLEIDNNIQNNIITF
jgi:hypothetical protein